MLIGLSVSCCVRDIAYGLVSYDDVICLVTNTRAGSVERWVELVREYRTTHWNHAPDPCSDVLWRLIHENKIIQPRLFGKDPPAAHETHWLKADLTAFYPTKG